MALLSQTLSSGSTSRWIIPARIRNASKNDIVFIGETSIQLREFVTTSEAHLRDVTGNFNIRTSILAAKVITAQAVPIDFHDQVVQQTVEEERYMLGNEPLPEDQPPQILVLSLASCELAFVYAREHLDGTVTFQWARRPVLSGIDLPDRFAGHLAVDPESRALAFAPSMGCFAIASLQPIDVLKNAIDKWKPASPKTFLPWTEQHFIQVDGYVLKMDFLQGADDDRSKVFLVLLVANAGETSLLLYRWDTRAKLHLILPMRCSGQLLRHEDSFPLMLIPCMALASFFLVTETELVLYSQVTAGKARRSAYLLPARWLKESASPSPSRQLLWTQWAKPRRHKEYASTNDDIMLVREDGLLQYFVICHKSEPRASVSLSAGHLGFDVDSAFCMLSTPHSIGGGDILIAGGSMNNGGVFHLEAQKPPRQLQSLPNAAPTYDLLMLNSDLAQTPQLSEHRLYACSGNRDGQGAIVQIQHGFEAQTGWTIAHSDAPSIERIWTIEAREENVLLILFSHSAHTSLILFNEHRNELEYATNETHPEVEFDSPTLAAASLGDDVVVQVTERNMAILSFSNGFPAIRKEFKASKPLCAGIVEDSGTVVVGHPTVDGFAISIIDLRRNTVDEDPLIAGAKLQYQPITIHIARFHDTSVLFVGTEQGQLIAFTIDEDLKLAKVFDRNLSDIDHTVQDSTVSSICLLCCSSSTGGLLLCGLRSGHLLCVELKAKKLTIGSLQIDYQNGELYRLGSTAVQISPDDFTAGQGSVTSAFAVCRSTLKYVALKDNATAADYAMSSVFVADRENFSDPFPVINFVHRVQRLRSDPSNDINGLLMCATSDAVLFSSLVAQPTAVFRRTPVPGIPKRLIYSPFLKQLVVGVDTFSGPRIIFMTPSAKDSDQTTHTASQSVIIGDATERIHSVLNYKPTEDNAHFQFLVVALNSVHTDPVSGAVITTGNVVCLSLKRIQRGKADSAKAQPVMRLPGNAITALCACGHTSMLIGTEKKLILHNFVFATRGWEKLSEFELPSAAMSIDVREGRIFVATQRHNLMQFKESSEGNLVLLETDTKAGNTTKVLAFGKKGTRQVVVLGISDRGTTITGMAEDRIKGGLSKLWEGAVPLLVEDLVEERVGIDSGGEGERSVFVGVTKDGTLYRFVTLKADEFELLKWLEELCIERKGGTKRRLVSRTERQVAEDGSMQRVQVVNTHVDGDALTGMVEMGVMNLREVLEPRIKEEREDGDEDDRRHRKTKMEELTKLAYPLMGDVEDVVGAVIVWLRRVLSCRFV